MGKGPNGRQALGKTLYRASVGEPRERRIEEGKVGKKDRASPRAGFTLIELLVTVALVAILAALALPGFAAYRVRGLNAHAVSALTNLARAQEAHYSGTGQYSSAIEGLPGYVVPESVDIAVLSSDASGFTAWALHTSGDKLYSWDSSRGGLQAAAP